MPGWVGRLSDLERASGIDTGTYDGYLASLQNRREYFVAHGAVSADHSHPDVQTEALDADEAHRIFDAARSGQATVAESTAFRRHMLAEMARMSCEDGLVMTLHPGICRDHHGPTAARFGSDSGHDIPIAMEFTPRPAPTAGAIRDQSELAPCSLHSRRDHVLPRDRAAGRLLPLGLRRSSVVVSGCAGCDPSLPGRRHRKRWGFTRTSGFIDDTRAFCSIPARHDMARRLDAGHLAGLVAQHRLAEDESFEIARSLVVDNPRRVFKL